MAWIDRAGKNWVLSILLLVSAVVGSLYASNLLQGVRADASSDDLHQMRETLLADSASISGHWLRTLNPLVKDVQGDLVWNSQQQQGVMRIRDLPAPKNGEFYQLWLYDTRSAADAPVSGAILRKGAGREELYVPIKADTPVQEPYKFVLKLEKANAASPAQVLLMVQP